MRPRSSRVPIWDSCRLDLLPYFHFGTDFATTELVSLDAFHLECEWSKLRSAFRDYPLFRFIGITIKLAPRNPDICYLQTRHVIPPTLRAADCFCWSWGPKQTFESGNRCGNSILICLIYSVRIVGKTLKLVADQVNDKSLSYSLKINHVISSRSLPFVIE